MPYYVNIDQPTRIATVHKAECPHCNNGRGQSGRGPALQTSTWRGPFGTGAGAVAVVDRSETPVVRACGDCAPHLGAFPG